VDTEKLLALFGSWWY